MMYFSRLLILFRENMPNLLTFNSAVGCGLPFRCRCSIVVALLSTETILEKKQREASEDSSQIAVKNLLYLSKFKICVRTQNYLDFLAQVTQ